MSTTYMTVKLNLSDGTIVYPQVSLDNIVASISDPTLVQIATLSGGTVSTSQLPVVTTVGNPGTNTTIPTEAAVRSALATVAGTATPMTTAARTATTPAAGALIWDTDLETLFIGDGSTAGGVAIQGGGGGGDYVGQDGIEIVSGSTIRANTATADELISGTTVTKLVDANAYRTLNHDEPVIFGGSTASLAANTVFEFCDGVYAKKGDEIQVYFEFIGDFGNFDIIHESTLGGTKYRITSTAVQVYDSADTLQYTYDHGLTLSTFVNIEIQRRISYRYFDRNIVPRVKLELSTLSGSFTLTDLVPLGDYGNYVVTASFAVSNLTTNYIVSDARKRIWVFGDSYTVMATYTGWPYHLPYNLADNIAFFGFNGANSMDMIETVRLLIAKTRPEYIVWALGMNDRDSGSSLNANWKTCLDELEHICADNAVQLVLVTIPNVPNVNNTLKNAYIHSLDYPVIDFAKAVNADTAGATWYDGLLSEDNLHPSTLGAMTLANAFTRYFATSFYLSDAGVVANEITQDLRKNIINSIPTGYGLVVGGGTISQNRFVDIEEINPSVRLTVIAGHSYTGKVSATQWLATENYYATKNGLDAHLSVLLAEGWGFHTDAKMAFISKPEPLALNNLTVHFRAGKSYVSLDDCFGGYVVKSTSGSTAGTLAYGLTASDEYICFEPTIDGSTISFGTVTTYNGEKYIHGNGQDKTFISGSINCSGKVVASNLALTDVTITGGTFKLGNVTIPAGSTVALTGDAVIGAVNGVTINGPGTLDFGLIYHVGSSISTYANLQFIGLKIINGLGSGGAFLQVGTGGNVNIESCEITGNTTTYRGILSLANGTTNIKNCYMHGNKAPGSDYFIYVSGSATVNITGGTFTENSQVAGTSTTSFFDHVIWTAKIAGVGKTKLTSGVTFDMTGNANTDVITGGTLIVEDGASVITTGGSTVALTGGTYTTLKNDGTLS